MLSTDSFPKKWSMRKICDSSKCSVMTLLSAFADLRSCPNGFSQMTLACSLSPDSPSISTIEGNASGGTARWWSRRGLPPISSSACSTAARSPLASPGSATPNRSAAANWSHFLPSGAVRPNCCTASLAWSRNASSVTAKAFGDEPMIRKRAGRRSALKRW